MCHGKFKAIPSSSGHLASTLNLAAFLLHVVVLWLDCHALSFSPRALTQTDLILEGNHSRLKVEKLGQQWPLSNISHLGLILKRKKMSFFMRLPSTPAR